MVRQAPQGQPRMRIKLILRAKSHFMHISTSCILAFTLCGLGARGCDLGTEPASLAFSSG